MKLRTKFYRWRLKRKMRRETPEMYEALKRSREKYLRGESSLPPEAQAILDNHRQERQRIVELARTFSSADIPNMTDDELGKVASEWLHNTYPEDEIHQAPAVCQHVVACDYMYGCVCNGGLSSLYQAGTYLKSYIPAAMEGFVCIGLPQVAEIMQKADDFMRDKYDENGTATSKWTAEEETDGEELDAAFYAACTHEDLNDRLAAYIRAHAEHFGAPQP
ncbi:MAG: DMP19 family protein [Oscillospiraceae bacterium]|nr:DMP19 family protein [Oscillospiraceae bacterium]